MLTLILMRHAQATDSDTSDKQRTLTNKGRMQATESALQIEALQLKPTLIISSDAQRAVQTADILADKFPQSRRLNFHQLYESYTTQDLLSILATCALSSDECVAVVGHNPDITYKANQLCEKEIGYYFKTAGFLVLNFDAQEWEEVTARTGIFAGSNMS